MMRILAAAALVIAAGVLILAWGSDNSGPSGGGNIRACLVTPTCGSKDGKRKEYVHACAAEDDGATEIGPMRRSTCDGF